MSNQATATYAECIGGPRDGRQERCQFGDVWAVGFGLPSHSGRYELDRDALVFRWVPDATPTDRSEPS